MTVSLWPMIDLWGTHRYTPEIPDLLYHPNFGVFGFLSTKKMQNKFVQNLQMVCNVLLMFVFMLRLQYATDEPWIFWFRKTQKHPLWAPCRDKDGTGSCISWCYICESTVVFSHIINIKETLSWYININVIFCCYMTVDNLSVENIFLNLFSKAICLSEKLHTLRVSAVSAGSVFN